VGEVATEDIGVEVDRFEVTRRGMAHHSGGFTAAHVEWGGAPEERRRLELELSMSSMWTRQSSWHGWLDRGMAGGAGSTVQCSHGLGRWCGLCFGDFLRGWLGG
jgi:hypothetical protein